MSAALKPYPLLLQPVYQDYLWGGERIARRFARRDTPRPCAESWEVADRPEGRSRVANGPAAGRCLHELVRQWGPELLGRGARDERFPLLIKIIDAERTLSVQVHPNEATAGRTGGEPKTEMWYILEADTDACVYVGLRPGTARETFVEALRSQSLQQVLHRVPARPGEAVYVPGGRVHAIAAGCLLLEVQQNSNTTYRVYDWGRVAEDGSPRPLHVDEALATIAWDDPPGEARRPRELARGGGWTRWHVMSGPFFHLERLDLNAAVDLPPHPGSFQVLFTANGSLELQAGAATETLAAGTSCLLPAALDGARLTPLGRASVMRICRSAPPQNS